MASASTIRTRVYEYLYSAFPNDRPFESLLTEALDNSETDIDVTDGTDWEESDVLEVVETGEQCLVLSVATNTLTVQRSFGTVDATAAADAGRIRKNPRFTQDQLDTAITEAANTLEAWGVHSYSTGSFALAASQWYFELSETDIDSNYGVLSVYYVDDTTKQPQPIPFVYYSGLSTGDADWTQGRGVKILSKGDRNTTDTLYFTYARSLEFDTDLDTTLAKVLAPQEELVVLGAVTRLLGGTIVPMTQDHGQRTDRSIPPGQTSRDVRYFQGDFFIKARAEAARLAVERTRLPRARQSNRARRWRW